MKGTDRELKHGFCCECQKPFIPDSWARCQFFCFKCRQNSFFPGDSGSSGSVLKELGMVDDLILKPGFLNNFMAALEGFVTFRKRIKIDCTATTLYYWNNTGRVPAGRGGVKKLCRALKMSKTELEQRYGR